ncbi:MAG TPA: protein-L-isoaspartate(D-aspartate) O-methyltransferase [Paludibacter sp.]|nr:protein-L-isoaspartate(D-aspartate) O-methyltransferase [Paludibacter sp.]
MNEIDYDRLRKGMVEYQLKGNGIHSQSVLNAFLDICRHKFLPLELRERAYENNPLPIGFDQTISQPYIVAYMIEKLNLSHEMSVLEIGTGSGYQTAILSCLCHEVYSVEINGVLAKRAAKIFTEEGLHNIKVKVADGYNGWREYAPFDRIIVSCAPIDIPQTLADQLADGGRMIIPVGATYSQKLFVVEKRNGIISQTESLPVRFVPMVFKG